MAAPALRQVWAIDYACPVPLGITIWTPSGDLDPATIADALGITGAMLP